MAAVSKWDDASQPTDATAVAMAFAVPEAPPSEEAVAVAEAAAVPRGGG